MEPREGISLVSYLTGFILVMVIQCLMGVLVFWHDGITVQAWIGYSVVALVANVAMLLYVIFPLAKIRSYFFDYEYNLLPTLPQNAYSRFKEIQSVINAVRGIDYKNAELSAMREKHAAEQNLFFANASHELRTPLTALMGWVDLLEEEALGPMTLEQQDAIKAIQAATQRLTVMVNNTIDLSKIEVGKMQVEETEFDPRDEMEFIQAQFAPQVAKKRQTMFFRFDDNLPNVLGDSDKFKQVMTNLVSNAVKYTPEGGTITVSVEHCENDPQCVKFRVADTGVGIPKSSLEEGKLFSKFYQVRVKDARVGSGLGLAIVKELAHLMHGEVTVESIVNQGTTFTVLMPGKTHEEDLGQVQEPVHH